MLRVCKREGVISRSVECYMWFSYAGGARFKLLPEQAGYQHTVHSHVLHHSVTQPRTQRHSVYTIWYWSVKCELLAQATKCV